MRIPIPNGSPRLRGNTRTALPAMKSMPGTAGRTAEPIDAARPDIGGCTACDGCKKNGGRCVFPDDSDRVIMKVAAADAVIFGPPVYRWGISSQLKALPDRFCSRTAYFMEQRRQIGVLTVGANGTDDPQYRLIRSRFACIAEYLHWTLSFSLSFSACGAGELRSLPALEAELRRACASLK